MGERGRECSRQRKEYVSSKENVCSGKGQKFRLACMECSMKRAEAERQVAARELTRSHTTKDLNELCWDFIIKLWEAFEEFQAEERGHSKE